MSRTCSANVSLDAFRSALKVEIFRDEMETKLVDGVTKSPTPQRHVAEIYVASDPSDTAQGDEVNVRHILYSPRTTSNARARWRPTTRPGRPPRQRRRPPTTSS